MRLVREVLHLRTAGVGLNEVAPARPRIPDLKPALRLRRDTDPRTPALPLQASIRLRLGRRFVSVVNLMHDGGLIAPLPRLRWTTYSLVWLRVVWYRALPLVDLRRSP